MIIICISHGNLKPQLKVGERHWRLSSQSTLQTITNMEFALSLVKVEVTL